MNRTPLAAMATGIRVMTRMGQRAAMTHPPSRVNSDHRTGLPIGGGWGE